ncbi:MAG: beta-eliminating lyase-related protein [Pseudomonadota bacterium]
MLFTSDNWAGAHPKVIEAISQSASGYVPPHGRTAEDEALKEKFCDIFEHEVSVFLVSTGTAANALALSAMARPGDVIFCHEAAHIRVDECGAPWFFSQGLQLEAVSGGAGKIDGQALQAKVQSVTEGGLNAGRVGGLSLTQATEGGTLYSPAEITELSGLVSGNTTGRRPPVHMDGSRFSNAVAASGTTPAHLTWKNGVDLLSFGGTKNGCICAEALIVFDPTLAESMEFLRKRSGHLISKLRFMTAQFMALMNDNLWLECATIANTHTTALADIVRGSDRMRLAWEPEINEIFAICKRADFQKWSDVGLQAFVWQPTPSDRHLLDEDECLIRLVTSFETEQSHIEALARLI